MWSFNNAQRNINAKNYDRLTMLRTGKILESVVTFISSSQSGTLISYESDVNENWFS